MILILLVISMMKFMKLLNYFTPILVAGELKGCYTKNEFGWTLLRKSKREALQVKHEITWSTFFRAYIYWHVFPELKYLIPVKFHQNLQDEFVPIY